jgi:predicted Zn-dependent peptidase
MEDTRSVSGWLGGQEILSREILTPDEVVTRLEDVTTEDASAVMRSLLRRDQLNLAIVGPHRSAKRFLPLLDL